MEFDYEEYYIIKKTAARSYVSQATKILMRLNQSLRIPDAASVPHECVTHQCDFHERRTTERTLAESNVQQSAWRPLRQSIWNLRAQLHSNIMFSGQNIFRVAHFDPAVVTRRVIQKMRRVLEDGCWDTELHIPHLPLNSAAPLPSSFVDLSPQFSQVENHPRDQDDR